MEWFSQTSPLPDADSKFYKIKKSKKNGTNELNTGIVTLDQVQQSIHLIPVFPKNSTNTLWTSETVLDPYDTFFINNWSNIRIYQHIY